MSISELIDSDDEDSIYSIKDHFIDISLIGSGSFGKVIRGFSKELKKICAIKILKKKKSDLKSIEAFRNEENLLSNLDHKNIVKFYYSKETQLRIYMVLEYIEGMTLYEYLKSKNYKIDEKTIRFIMKELLISLEYIHSNKIVHRDIKPENIIVILNKEKEIINLKIIDFGLSQKLLGYNLLWGKVGTPIYFAPEIALEKSYSYSVDIWSLGIIFYMLISNYQHPIFDLNKDNYDSFLIKLTEWNPEKHENMSLLSFDLYKKMTNFEPNERINSQQALSHSWVTQKEVTFLALNSIDKIRSVKNTETFIDIVKIIFFINFLKKKCPIRKVIVEKNICLNLSLIKEDKNKNKNIFDERNIRSNSPSPKNSKFNNKLNNSTQSYQSKKNEIKSKNLTVFHKSESDNSLKDQSPLKLSKFNSSKLKK